MHNDTKYYRVFVRIFYLLINQTIYVQAMIICFQVLIFNHLVNQTIYLQTNTSCYPYNHTKYLLIIPIQEVGSVQYIFIHLTYLSVQNGKYYPICLDPQPAYAYPGHCKKLVSYQSRYIVGVSLDLLPTHSSKSNPSCYHTIIQKNTYWNSNTKVGGVKYIFLPTYCRYLLISFLVIAPKPTRRV